MKTKKAYLVIVILLLGSLIGNNVFAQYGPETKLPSLKSPFDENYDYQHGDRGFVRVVGSSSTRQINVAILSLREMGMVNVLESPQMERYLLYLLEISLLLHLQR